MYRVELDDDAELELTALTPHTRRNVKEVLRRLRRGPDSALGTYSYPTTRAAGAPVRGDAGEWCLTWGRAV